MTTTLMRDSIVGDAWIQATAAAIPIQWVLDANGQRTGDILTGPVRLSWTDIMTLPAPTAEKPNPKYSSAILFTPLAKFDVLYEAYNLEAAKSFAANYDQMSGQYYGLHSPFRWQHEKLNLSGYTPNCMFITASTKYKPSVIDAQGNVVQDPSRVYPGVWAICAVNTYANADARTKGVRFGLQSVMLIGDDTPLGGKGVDPQKMFGGVRGSIAPPVVNPALMGGRPQAGAPGAPPGFVPPPAGGTYAPGYTPPPQAPAYGAPPAGQFAPPAQHHQPSMPPGYGGAPQGYGAPAFDPRGPAPAGFASWADYDAMFR